MARTFHRLHPSTDWDRATVTKPRGSDVYIVDLYCVDRRVETINILPPLSNMLAEIQAMGCNVSSYRQYLPKQHMDI